jgi:arginine-tRNA-protein transferase
MVYSFYDPREERRSLGTFIILDHIVQATLNGLPYVYLGYWVPGSEKMAYKARFSPLEVLKGQGWMLMSARERDEAGEALDRERRLRGPVVPRLGKK